MGILFLPTDYAEKWWSSCFRFCLINKAQGCPSDTGWETVKTFCRWQIVRVGHQKERLGCRKVAVVKVRRLAVDIRSYFVRGKENGKESLRRKGSYFLNWSLLFMFGLQMTKKF